MIGVYLLCGHIYEAGFLTQIEKETRLTVCPKCRQEVKIIKAFERVHPPDSKKKWVDGAEIKLGVKA